jgi:hypothetical protein
LSIPRQTSFAQSKRTRAPWRRGAGGGHVSGSWDRASAAVAIVAGELQGTVPESDQACEGRVRRTSDDNGGSSPRRQLVRGPVIDEHRLASNILV